MAPILTRRAFLRDAARAGFSLGSLSLGGAAVSGLTLGACSQGKSSAPANLILGGGRYQDLDTGRVAHVFSIVDLDTQAVDLIDVDFLPHGIHLHPTEPHRLAVFEKKGPHAALVDLEARRVLRPLRTDTRRYFYGHGAYSADGKQLFATETVLDDLRGVLVVRDAESDAVLGTFPSYGLEPHEVKLIDGGRTLVVTNGGGQIGAGDDAAPNVAYIDAASERLLERVPLTDTRINTGHAAVARDGALVVVSAPRSGLAATETGGVSIRPAGGGMQTLREPRAITARMQGEALSVAIAEADAQMGTEVASARDGIAAVTHPDGDLVTFWSTRTRALLHSIELARPRGVTLTADGEAFVISYGQEASLLRVSVQELRPLEGSVVPNTYISGSHLYNWSRGLTEILAPRSMSARG